MKVGKAAAVAVGGGMIMLQIANHKGYVKVNWDKMYKNVEEQVDKIEASSSKGGSKMLDKVRLMWNLYNSTYVQLYCYRLYIVI